MPRTRSLAWSELKIGVLTIIAVAIASATIFLLTGTKGFSWQRYSLKTQFGNVAGLKAGSPVRVAGVDVGTVRSVDLIGEKVDVSFEVNKKFRDRITTGSRATLGSVSLLGESAVDISPSTTGTSIPDGGYVPTGRTAALLSDVTTQASQGIEELTALIHDARQGRGTFGKLMTDDRLYVELSQFIASSGELVNAIRSGRGTLGRLVNDPRVAESLDTSLKNVVAITEQITSGRGSLGKLLKDQTFADSLSGATSNLRDLTARLNEGDFANSLNGATSNLRDVTGRLNRGEGTAGKLITDDALYNRLNGLTDRFEKLMTALNEGQGTAGLLLKDKQLYENMNTAVAEFRNLLVAIQKDPKRYLNVKVSIF